MKIIKNFSPNYDKKKRPIKSIQIIVFHYTGMQSERESLLRLCNPTSEVSSHYLISKKGDVYSLVSEKKRAWHAGKSYWKGEEDINSYSIGIELDYDPTSSDNKYKEILLL